MKDIELNNILNLSKDISDLNIYIYLDLCLKSFQHYAVKCR